MRDSGSVGGGAEASPTATESTPPASASGSPSGTPKPTAISPSTASYIGYAFEQIAAACIPAIEANYPGTTVTESSSSGPWVIDESTPSSEWLTYIPDGVTWTTNTDIIFSVLCDVTNADLSTPSVVYIGVANQ